MLADPAYSDLVHSIGIASLGATEKEIWHLAKAYFSTVEFGVVWESGKIKAFGAGEVNCLPLFLSVLSQWVMCLVSISMLFCWTDLYE